MEISEQLRGFEAFSHFDGESRDRLAACAWRQTFDPGAYVFRQGDPSREPFALFSGSISLRIASPNGEFDLGTLGPGHLFGEANYIDHLGRSSDAVSRETCEVVLFDADRLAAMAENDPGFELALLWSFWHSLARKLRRANSQLNTFFSDRGASPPLDVPAKPRHSEHGLDLSARRAVFLEQRLSPMEIHFLASLSSEERFLSGETIFREGDPGDKMYVVLEGRVMISKSIPGAGEEALAFLERGDYFGEMALIDDEVRSASAKSHEPDGCVVLSIAREVVEGLLNIDSVASTRLLSILCGLGASRLRAIDQKIVGWYVLAQRTPSPGADLAV